MRTTPTRSFAGFLPATLVQLTRIASAAAAILLVNCCSLWATPLPVGATLYPNATFAEPDPTGGVVLASTGPVAFASATYSGHLTSTVITGDPSNPLGGLTFTYLLSNDVGSAGTIDRLTISDFTGFLTDASFQVPLVPGTLPPTFVDRPVPATVGFSFIGAPIGPGVLPPGTTSALLVIQTNSPLFHPSSASVIDGSVTTVASFAPVPEPSTLGLAAIGIVGIAAYMRRRQVRR